MRDAVRLRMSKEQYQEFRDILSCLYNVNMLTQGQYPLVSEFMKNANEAFFDEPGDLIERARADYSEGSDDDIEVDDDAPLSRTDDGVWVGGWLWVPNVDQ